MDLEQDHAGIAWSHWPAQFEDGTRIEALVQALNKPHAGVQLALKQLHDSRWLDTAEGKQLDGIGEIVGLPRRLDDVAYIQFFGFNGQPNIATFGEGRMRRSFESTVGGSTLLLDPEYRRLLRWKIAINNGHGTTEEIIAAVKAIMMANKVIVQNIGNAKIAIWVNRLPVPGDPLTVNPARWVPSAAGVGVQITVSTEKPFGFSSQGYYGFGVGTISQGI